MRKYNTYGGPSNSYLLRRYGHIDALPLPPVLLKKLSPELRTWPHGNIADDFEISGQDVLEAVVAHWKQTRKGKTTEVEKTAHRDALLERVDRWLEASGFGDTFVVEYDVDEVLDEMIPFVKLLIMDSATFEAGKAKQKIPKSKIDGDDEGKQVVRILKTVLNTQRQGMGGDAKAILSALEKHATEPLPLNQYHAYAIKAAIYRLLHVAEKALDDKLKDAIKSAQEKAKSGNSKKRSHTDNKGGSSKKPKAK
ncbi:hypothetical protein QFC22_000990 [Naganishia vaughanmartiniae]|uniref:Uncharacterized protein n=1 Tax=Naganishia vaughanmartiniae TaxID=1424756 RepID=A0ACC2XJL4_9TREE|nr:hypothetical protein QFC22_000990 [Naganishia vaughanmartiniae]